jgi:hypothetical protein
MHFAGFDKKLPDRRVQPSQQDSALQAIADHIEWSFRCNPAKFPAAP